MRIHSWLVLAVVLAGCPDINLEEDSEEGDCGGDAGPCQSPSDATNGGAGSGGGSKAGRGGSDDDGTVAFDGGVAPGTGGAGGGAGGAGGADGAEGAGSDFVAVLTAFNSTLCECLGQSIDDCTETTPEQRACEAAVFTSGVAELWFECMTQYLSEQTDCVAAAACDSQALSQCDVIAGSADGGDPFEGHCGAQPVALENELLACSPDTSPSDTFMCGSGESIPSSYVCDTDDDCTDASDEADCEGRVFECGDGQTVRLDYVCDGEPDCVNASDEASCGFSG